LIDLVCFLKQSKLAHSCKTRTSERRKSGKKRAGFGNISLLIVRKGLDMKQIPSQLSVYLTGKTMAHQALGSLTSLMQLTPGKAPASGLDGIGGWISCLGLSAGSFGDAGEWLPGWRGIDGAGRCHSRHGVQARNPESGRPSDAAGHPFLAWP